MAVINARYGASMIIQSNTFRGARPKLAQVGLGDAGSWPQSLLYGVAHYGKMLAWYTSELVFAFFLTEIGGIAPHWMGLVLAAGLVASALTDLAAGAWTSHIIRGPKSAGRVQLAGAIGSSVALTGMFFTHLVEPEKRIWYALIVSLGFRLSYSLYDMPQNAMISLATRNDEARTRLVAIRLWFSGLASLTVAGTLAPIALSGDISLRASRFELLAVTFSGFAVASSIALYRIVRSIDHLDQLASVSQVASGRRTSRAQLLLLSLMFVSSLGTPVFSKVAPYYAAFDLHSPVFGTIVMVGVSLGATLSQPLWAYLSALASRPLSIAGAGLAVFVSAGAFLLSSGQSAWVTTIWGAAFGAASGGLGMTLWAAYGDIVSDRSKGGEVLAYAMFTAASKVAITLTILGIGTALSSIDYRHTGRGYLVFVMAIPSVLAGLACLIAALVWQLKGGVRSPAPTPAS